MIGILNVAILLLTLMASSVCAQSGGFLGIDFEHEYDGLYEALESPIDDEVIETSVDLGGYSSTVNDGVLQSVRFHVSKEDITGPHERSRRWVNHDAITLKVTDYRGSGFHKSHGRALGQTSKEQGASTNSTLNCWPAYPSVNQGKIREAERLIEFMAPCNVTITAQYDGEGAHLKGVEVPDAFLYEIKTDIAETRYFVANGRAE